MEPVKTPSHLDRALRGSSKGFTLVELLVVIAIIAIISAASMPAIQSTLESTAISMGGQTLAGQINLARQMASSRNAEVQVRLIQLPGVSAGYNAIQLWGTYSGSSTEIALSPMVIMPVQVVVSQNTTYYSPLLATSAVDGEAVSTSLTMSVPTGTANYIYFSIMPSGMLPVTNATAGGTSEMTGDYLTVVPARFGSTSTAPGATGAPKNYLIVQLNPTTSATLVYQP